MTIIYLEVERNMCGRRFSSNEELKDALITWLEDQYKEFYFKGISSLKVKWNKCIELLGDYIEK